MNFVQREVGDERKLSPLKADLSLLGPPASPESYFDQPDALDPLACKAYENETELRTFG